MNKGLLTALSLMVGASCAQANGIMDSVDLAQCRFAREHSPVRPVTAADVADQQVNGTAMPRSRSSEDLTQQDRQEFARRSTWYGSAFHKAKSFFRYVISLIAG